MAWDLVERVLLHSRTKGSDRLVLLAIAYAHSDSEAAQGSRLPVATLVRCTGLHERYLRTIIGNLRGCGELHVTQCENGRGPNLYRIEVPEQPSAPAPARRKPGRPALQRPESVPKVAAVKDQAPKQEPHTVPGPGFRPVPKAESARGTSTQKRTTNGKSAAMHHGEVHGQVPTPAPNVTQAPMPMPAGYKVRPDTIAWAEAKATEYNVKMNAAAFAEKFEHHYTNGKGKGLKEIDWDAKFKTWVFEDIEKRSLEAKSNGRHSENGIGLAAQPGPDAGRANGAPPRRPVPKGFNVERYGSGAS